ncbi:MAG: radical SAM protein, partial [Acidobacteria bacterium]|nr:radical SAM protein [Acidobacteriota bacterium]
EHAVRRGVFVTLFTNGTLLTERTVDRLAALPPYGIEVTLYGYSRETYEKVTGIPGSRDKCYRGVELLLERKLPLKLKTVVINTNKHEFMDMFHFAESRGMDFKWDTQISPNFDRSLTPCNVRLSPEEAVDFDFAIPSRVEQWRRYFEPRKQHGSSRVFTCGAGSRAFHIDPYGNMKMCVLLREPEYSLKEMSFRQIWDEMFPPIYTRLRRSDHGCNSCNLYSLCGKCPAWSQLEKGDMEEKVDYSCEVGHRRAQKLGYYDGPVDQYSRVSGRPAKILLPVLR